MIVNTGKDVIKNFFGRQYPVIADAIAVGTGTTAATLTDTGLQTEVTRLTVTSVSADIANSKIIFKAILPAGALATIYEVGIFYNGQAVGGSSILVARTVLTTPATVDPIIPTDIEYSLVISV